MKNETVIKKIFTQKPNEWLSVFPRCSVEGLQGVFPLHQILQFSTMFTNLHQVMLEPDFAIWGPIPNPHAQVKQDGLLWPSGQAFCLITIALKG